MSKGKINFIPVDEHQIPALKSLEGGMFDVIFEHRMELPPEVIFAMLSRILGGIAEGFWPDEIDMARTMMIRNFDQAIIDPGEHSMN